MQYLKSRWFKIIFIALPLLLIIIMFFYSLDYLKKSRSGKQQADISNIPKERYDNFRVDKISIVKRAGNSILFSLSADKVVHRKRISRARGLFVYQNLKEIYMSGVQIDIYPHNNAPISRQKNIAIPVNDIGSSFISFGKSSTPIEEYLAGNADFDLDLLTRVLFEGLSISIHLPHNKRVSLSAKSARLNIDFENIILEGPVEVIASDGKGLYSHEAVWSKKFNGIYFPKGYALQSNYLKEKAFFVINQKGEFSKVSRLPKIRYADLIEEREKVLYSYIFKNAPPYAKFMFDMPLK